MSAVKKQQKEKVYKYPSPCVSCGKKLKNKQIASQHHAHDCDGYFECNLCYGQYTRSGDLLRHTWRSEKGMWPLWWKVPRQNTAEKAYQRETHNKW